ncbi:MAG: hypothetical protein EA424_08285 [Planctomycetaceae bacterium]|nr:MAG: hypothetical protein EA424_08285 [Planctomycetaceae bacterium]
MASIDGIVTGLNTTEIIDGLLAMQQRRVAQLDARKETILTKQAAFTGIEARLLSLRTTLGRLASTRRSVFEDRTIDVSDPERLTAAASSKAATGSYELTIESLARAHQIASGGLDDPDGAITQGELTIQIGSSPGVTLSIDGNNNTLRGLADTINASGAGVTATIINDRTGATPYRLMLTAKATGASHAISVTNDLAESNGEQVRPDFSGPALQEAADARVLLGSGDGALVIQHDSNIIDDVIRGITLNLHEADPARSIRFQVSRDTSAVKTAVTDFVDSFNSLMGYIDDQVRYDAAAQQSSPLLGERSVVNIQDTVRRAVMGTVAGLPSEWNRLTAIGISVTDRGRLVLDNAKLDAAMSASGEGQELGGLQRLFGLTGVSDNPGVRFLLAGSKTQVANHPIQVDITSPATRASVVAATALPTVTQLTTENNTLQVKVDGKASAVLELAPGEYTRQELAALIQETLRNDPELIGSPVSVAVQDGHLRFRSQRYGADSEIRIISGSALAPLGLEGTEHSRGQDVMGRFLVNGVEEAATGTGRTLIGQAGNATTDGLQVQVTLSEAQVQPGVDANLTLTQGVASRLEHELSRLLDPVHGNLQHAKNAYTDRIASIDASIARVAEVTDQRREALLRQFAALESTMSRLQQVSGSLNAFLTSMPGLRG